MKKEIKRQPKRLALMEKKDIQIRKKEKMMKNSRSIGNRHTRSASNLVTTRRSSCHTSTTF